MSRPSELSRLTEISPCTSCLEKAIPQIMTTSPSSQSCTVQVKGLELAENFRQALQSHYRYGGRKVSTQVVNALIDCFKQLSQITHCAYGGHLKSWGVP
ncbi:hypothetical protein L873DRAFT_332447 [Choiromyces venosus 120613-1]|uniref:Uncharacterized protein n=1 Tax=Choiromyces venosus 120613-1 TaxID=1336337 RepID=A0A3N4JXB5_9PEZI|nr:hypothetical protein L873DRAFT_577844 [Choiromyces venosus 120613-1]RPB03004.1 hypothetical protein L873DRAFT_332447 [Choiromyces venosus 120613-1]